MRRCARGALFSSDFAHHHRPLKAIVTVVAIYVRLLPHFLSFLRPYGFFAPGLQQQAKKTKKKCAGLFSPRRPLFAVLLDTFTHTLYVPGIRRRGKRSGRTRALSNNTLPVLNLRLHAFLFSSVCFCSHFNFPASEQTRRGHRCRPFFPPVLAFNFYRA